ncbi:alpha-amylase family glycosyl hydrolase [Undibacterium sp. Ren11W]|uniref:alpha-amylase family glycosyl hydrolase n=1 Tax=Undibacterium sp. Ren11W TaxID=3413045 RepID=UPI003BF2EF10
MISKMLSNKLNKKFNKKFNTKFLAFSIALMQLSGPVSGSVVAPQPVLAHAVKLPFLWDNATVYFLLTDRFFNGDRTNDLAYGRKADAAPLRGFAGGDLAGITAKIEQGYFKDLGVNVIWLTPPVEQIHAGTDEGTGKSYGFHGYWARDFTRVDANLGTEADMRRLVDTAHAHGIRILLDVVMNHTGPETEVDTVWPADWVRTDPACTYQAIASTVSCTLVNNLPDFRTDSDASVALPPELVKKWKVEGRFQQELKELDAFFARTGWPRAPRYYLMKWHADWVRKFGVDGFRIDTAKHVEPAVWKELKQVASSAYEDWKQRNPHKKLGDEKFFMTGEVYNYALGHGTEFTMDGGGLVNFYANGFDSLINFGFKSDAKQSYETLFSAYSAQLHGALKGYSVLNYVSSHDDGSPFDAARSMPFETATKLLLSPGAAQIYYGDETARSLIVPGTSGDAALRSMMNWDELANNASRGDYRIAEVREHWSRLGLFRQAHVAVGAGVHQQLSAQPYLFKRTYQQNGIKDTVLVALDLPVSASQTVGVHGVFAEGQKLKDYYSGKTGVVIAGKVTFDSNKNMLLIAADE